MGHDTGARRRTARRWIVGYGRLGYAAKATVYIIIGLLALTMSLGSTPQPPTTEGALVTILVQPLGTLLLGLLTCGLFGYALWQFVAALVDGERDGADLTGVLARVGKVWGALVYALLGLEATGLLLWRFARGEQTQAWAGLLLRLPLGGGIATLLGAGIVSYGLYQFYAAYAPPIWQHVDPHVLRCRTGRLALGVGRFGLVARGIVFVLVGSWLVWAAIRHNPRLAAGLGATFGALGRSPLGPGLLAVVAAGFIAYGSFELFNAWHRRLHTG